MLIRVLITVALIVPFLLHNRGDISLRWLHKMEQFAYDSRLVLTLPRTRDDRIVILDLDERSLIEQGQWPWSRATLAELVDRLFNDYKVRVVGFDLVFAEDDRRTGLAVLDELAQGELSQNPAFISTYERIRPELESDRLFAESLASRPTILSYVFRHPGDAGDGVSSGMLPAPMISATDHDTQIPFVEAVAYTGPVPMLQSASAGGFIENALLDSDGSYRRAPLLQIFEGSVYPSLSLAIAREALDNPPLKFVFQQGSEGPRDGLDLDWLLLGDRRIPVDDQAAVLVPYRGDVGSFPYVSATDVLTGKAGQYPLQGAVVIMGASAAGLHDLRTTPVGERFTGVEIHANIVSGILDQSIRHHPRYVQGIEITMLLLLAIVMTYLLVRCPVTTASLFTAAIMIALVLINLAFWEWAQFVLPLASLLSFTFLLFFFQMIYGYFIESRGKRELSQLFGQYVPPELVAEMGRNPRQFSMESESREMTVMFADIRNFTGIAENLDPPEVSQLLNAFLTPMTRVIQRHRGTIDKYMGDAIMAFWGAPVSDRKHGRNALLAAIEMQGAISELQKGFDKKGWPEIKLGIGLNSGEMRVGNMGSGFRMAYTVMGDAVNLGARLESLTKIYGVKIAVGEKTRESVPDYGFLELDRVRVQGKDRPEAIFEPIGPLKDMGLETKSMLKRHASALRFYRSRDWDAAEKEFFNLSQLHPSRKMFTLYLDRITYFRSQPPPAEWDGVFSIEHK